MVYLVPTGRLITPNTCGLRTKAPAGVDVSLFQTADNIIEIMGKAIYLYFILFIMYNIGVSGALDEQACHFRQQNNNKVTKLIIKHDLVQKYPLHFSKNIGLCVLACVSRRLKKDFY